MREIITLQLGQASNYAATHFWNTQESYFTYSDQEESLVDHNVHWRAGKGSDGSETFLPRTVIYDLKGGFGSLRKINALYEAESEAAPTDLWSGPSAVHKQQPLEPSAYQQSLDAGSEPAPLSISTVRYWSDFSRVYYHPRSLVQLYDFELDSTTRPFERFPMGTELFDVLDKEHDLVDRDWRPFAEECDRLQGINVFTTIDDAWGGFAASYLESLRDEYPKTCIWVWGLQSPMLDITRGQRQHRLNNTAYSIERICAQASTLVPLSLPQDRLPKGLDIDLRSTWHTSAAMATAIESATLQSRLASNDEYSGASLDDLAESINPGGNQPLASLRMSLAATATTTTTPESQGVDLDFFQIGRKPGQSWDQDPQIFGQLSSFRGIPIPEDQIQGATERLGRPVIGNPVVHKYETPLKFPILDSFPRIYTCPVDDASIGLQTTLSSDSSIVHRIRALRSDVARSVPLDEREMLSNGLAELADAYREDWSSGSDLDDDDL